jgi:hypothetical protein
VLHPYLNTLILGLVHAAGYEVIRGISVRDFGLPAGVLKWIGVVLAFIGPAAKLPGGFGLIKKWQEARQSKPKSNII